MIVVSNGRAVDTDGLTEEEIMSLNDPGSWAKGRPPTDREMLDSKLGPPVPTLPDELVTVKKAALESALRKAAIVARMADELRDEILRIEKA